MQSQQDLRKNFYIQKEETKFVNQINEDCFKACINNLTSSKLTEVEESCLKGCYIKSFSISKLITESYTYCSTERSNLSKPIT